VQQMFVRLGVEVPFGRKFGCGWGQEGGGKFSMPKGV